MAYENKIYIRYIVISVIVAIANILTFSNASIGYLFVTIEVIILIFAFFSKSLTEYVAIYCIFVSNCIEFSNFVGGVTLYNLKGIRIAGINLCVWLLLPILVKFIRKPIAISRIKEYSPFFYKMGGNLIIINLIALVVGLSCIIFNDNGIGNLNGLTREFIACVYTMLFIPGCLYCGFLYISAYETDRLYILPASLQAVLIGNSAQLISSLIFKKYGYYGGVLTLVTSLVYFLLPLSILFISYRDIKYSKMTAILGLVGTMLAMAFNTNGKIVLFFGIALLALISKMLSGEKGYIKLLAIAISLFLLIIIPRAIDLLSSNSILFKSKFFQASNLLQIWKPNWLDELPSSPRIRIEEFRDVILEFLTKPWLIITGKGYLGSIVDKTGYFSTLPSHLGVFEEAEWQNGTYYNLHEISSLLLMYGCIGVFFSIKLVKKCIQEYKNNIWIFFGVIWFLLLYGYSFTLSVFGVLCLFYGMIQNDSKLPR